jgi:hypothetical protein
MPDSIGPSPGILSAWKKAQTIGAPNYKAMTLSGQMPMAPASILAGPAQGNQIFTDLSEFLADQIRNRGIQASMGLIKKYLMPGQGPQDIQLPR